MTKAKTATLLWLLIVAFASAGVTAYACDDGDSNFWERTYHYCDFEDLTCDWHSVCEHDICISGECSGYLVFCVYMPYCGAYSGCFNNQCTK
jgi:hypothetical protein